MGTVRSSNPGHAKYAHHTLSLFKRVDINVKFFKRRGFV